MASFTVQEGYNKRVELKIRDGELVIGRDETLCGYVVNDPNVSRAHAKIISREGRVRVEDLHSQNGTYVNSSPIDRPCELKHMDIIQIGRNIFVFNDSEPEMVSAGNTPLPDSLLGRAASSEKTGSFMTFDFMGQVVKKIEANMKVVFKGKPEVIRNMVVCLLADGHVLVEDVPGVGKSVMAQALAKSIRGVYKRIQFTPDMLPSDITGVSIYDERKAQFNFMPGPIFGNIILADEINRTTPRTQSSLLECMSESVVTIDGTPHVLPKPFFVVATQNPSDYHGTYPLPEPQLDRFLMRISIGYPDTKAEKEILSSQINRHPLNDISYVVEAMDILQCQARVRAVHVSEPVKDYIIRISEATRRHPALSVGCSPRASLALMRVSQSLASYYGREYVLPRDVAELAVPALAHRVILKQRARSESASSAEVIADILAKTPHENEEVKG